MDVDISGFNAENYSFFKTEFLPFGNISPATSDFIDPEIGLFSVSPDCLSVCSEDTESLVPATSSSSGASCCSSSPQSSPVPPPSAENSPTDPEREWSIWTPLTYDNIHSWSWEETFGPDPSQFYYGEIEYHLPGPSPKPLGLAPRPWPHLDRAENVAEMTFSSADEEESGKSTTEGARDDMERVLLLLKRWSDTLRTTEAEVSDDSKPKCSDSGFDSVFIGA